MYINEIGRRQISDTKRQVLEKTTGVPPKTSEAHPGTAMEMHFHNFL